MKKALVIVLAAIFAGVSAVFAYCLTSCDSSLFRANVKAMAQEIEINTSTNKTDCYNMYSNNSEYHTLVCGVCTFINAKGETIGGRCKNSRITVTINTGTSTNNN